MLETSPWCPYLKAIYGSDVSYAQFPISMGDFWVFNEPLFKQHHLRLDLPLANTGSNAGRRIPYESTTSDADCSTFKPGHVTPEYGRSGSLDQAQNQ